MNAWRRPALKPLPSAASGWRTTALLAMLCLVGCYGQTSDHERTVQNGLRIIPYAKEIPIVFPGAETHHFISYFGFSTNAVPWNSVVYWKDRYVFSLQINVRVDYTNNIIAEVLGPPKIHLCEVSSVSVGDSSGVEARMSNDYALTQDDWKKLVASKGDFMTIGIPLKTNSPVPGFRAYMRIARKAARG